ncbi:MAG: dCTP deaminase [Chlamydiota bacterium]
MIFSDKTIQACIRNEKIKIFPECNPADIRPAGIRLHLGLELLIPTEGQRVDLESCQEIQFDRITIPEEGFVIKPGEFVLGSTYEKLQVARDIVCHIDGRSTIARVGLAIHCTSGIIDGNFEEPRTIVLEIKNQGPFEIIMRYKMALALLSFNQLTTEIEQGVQKQYAGQNGTLAPNLKCQKR